MSWWLGWFEARSDVSFPWNESSSARAAPSALHENGRYKMLIQQHDGSPRAIVFPTEAACERAKLAEEAAMQRRIAEAERKARPGGDRVWVVGPLCVPT